MGHQTPKRSRKVMRISSLCIKTKAICAVTLIVVLILCGTMFTFLSVRQQRGQLDVIHAAAETVASQAIALIRITKDIQLDVVQVQQFLSDISATRGQNGLDGGLKEAHEFADKFGQDVSAATKITKTIHRQDIVDMLTETNDAFGPYYETGQRMAEAYIKGGPAGGNPMMPEFDKASDALQAKTEQMLSAADAVVGDMTQHLSGTISLIEDHGDRLVWWTAVLGVLGTILAAGLGGLTMVWLVRPIVLMTDATRQLAEGNLAVVVPWHNRRDEIGAMAAAVLVFRDHMIAENRLAAEQTAERERAAAEKHAALLAMANKIETDTTAALQEVNARTTAMTATADAMSASAVRTGSAAEGAAASATQALANSQTVASAAEELSASIREIGSQAAQSTEVVGRAVSAGRDTRSTIEALNEEVLRIGAVADIIGEIAAKTNLLALNATIEAARAGDAGKGFAVVASEVKQLATQTARSTEEIAQHIALVRNATGASVNAVAQIEKTIAEVNAIAGSIAAAVEEQQSATAEIARNVSQTASAANEMTERTQDVSLEAAQTGKHAADVREGAAALDTAVGELRHSVIRVVRTSASEVNRRLDQRYSADIKCRLCIDGVWSAASVADLSEHGAFVRGATEAKVGTRGTLAMDGVEMVVPFTVRAVDRDALHLAFELDEVASGRLRAVVEWSTSHRAA
jgi:methyl-accepting chemotaxis protein